jgi:hypothetical protein
MVDNFRSGGAGVSVNLLGIQDLDIVATAYHVAEVLSQSHSLCLDI